MGLVLERELFMILLFLLVLLTMIGLLFAVMFGYKYQEIITIFLTVELIMIHKLIQLHQIIEMNVDALEKNEQCSPYGNNFVHPDRIKLQILGSKYMVVS